MRKMPCMKNSRSLLKVTLNGEFVLNLMVDTQKQNEKNAKQQSGVPNKNIK